VERGYDAIADRFDHWQRAIDDSTRLARVYALLDLLPDRPDVLELGSGAGVRSTRILAERGRLTGVDLSAEQVRRARSRIPAARFVHGDLMTVELPAESFDAVVSFYVLNNLPREELGPLLHRVVAWLRPGGYFLASLPQSDNPGWRGAWLGTDMFFSGYEPAVTLRLAREAGLEVLDEGYETMLEPEDREGEIGPAVVPGRWLWLLARRPRSGGHEQRALSADELDERARDGEQDEHEDEEGDEEAAVHVG
jgi:SAM-dependent methyltransferase